MLHFQNSLEEIVLPVEDVILENKKVDDLEYGYGKIRYMEAVFRQKAGFRPKKDKRDVENLVNNVKVAIEQEKGLNDDILNCEGKLTSNIGQILKMIMDDTAQQQL